jgi:hypothetical protein
MDQKIDGTGPNKKARSLAYSSSTSTAAMLPAGLADGAPCRLTLSHTGGFHHLASDTTAATLRTSSSEMSHVDFAGEAQCATQRQTMNQ